MTSLWFLKLSFKCLDHLAWPLVALGYPLCASIQAIETDSYKETRNLISYWIILSLIYLFEYAFSRLLQWFQFWPYIKLMIIFCLITPDFGRASYAYNNLIRTYLSLNPQAVICRLNKLRNFFVKKDDFLLHVERYVNENGTEALEKFIASKTNERKLQTEHKAIEDLVVIEKKEIHAAKQDIPAVVPNLAPSEKDSPAIAIGKDKACGELPESCTLKEKVQKEWTCALCHVTTTSEKTLTDHLHGRKHKDTCQALKAQNQPDHIKSKTKKGEQVQKKPAGTSHTKFICEICNVYCPCEDALVSHKNGKKHLAKITTLI